MITYTKLAGGSCSWCVCAGHLMGHLWCPGCRIYRKKKEYRTADCTQTHVDLAVFESSLLQHAHFYGMRIYGMRTIMLRHIRSASSPNSDSASPAYVVMRLLSTALQEGDPLQANHHPSSHRRGSAFGLHHRHRLCHRRRCYYPLALRAFSACPQRWLP